LIGLFFAYGFGDPVGCYYVQNPDFANRVFTVKIVLCRPLTNRGRFFRLFFAINGLDYVFL